MIIINYRIKYLITTIGLKHYKSFIVIKLRWFKVLSKEKINKLKYMDLIHKYWGNWQEKWSIVTCLSAHQDKIRKINDLSMLTHMLILLLFLETINRFTDIYY